MPTFPAIEQSYGSRRDPRSGNRIHIGASDFVSHRPLEDGTRWDPTLFFQLISLEDLNTIRAFEAANRGTPFEVYYAIEDVTLTCVFADKPISDVPRHVNGVAAFDVTVPLCLA